MDHYSTGPTATPRINASLLGKYVNQTVRLVGRVVDQQHLNVGLETSDGERVLVKRTPQTAGIYSSNAFVEVFGNVQPDHSIQEIAVSGFGAAFGTKIAFI